MGDRSTDNPFGEIGRPLPGLVSWAEFDAALTAEKETELIEAAGIPDDEVVFKSRSLPRRTWFLQMVRSIVRSWLANDAHRPAVRAIADELRRLMRRLDGWLADPNPERLAKVTAAFEALTPEAYAEISRHCHVEVPAAADIRAGDAQALQRLYGLIPVTPALHGRRLSFGRDARFHGNGARELNRRNRPRDSRLEVLAMQLAVAYELATGRKAGRGYRAPFERFFFQQLLILLFKTDESERGHRVLRRVVRWHKSYGSQHQKAAKKRRKATKKSD
jgi:hypothetical protein